MPTLQLIPSPCQRPIVELRINNKPYKFLIDTGATHTFVVPELVTVLRRNTSGRVFSAGGSFHATVADIRFNFVGVSIHRLFVCEEIGNEPEAIRQQGVIGQDILQQFKSVTFDNVRRVVKFEL